MDRRGRSDSGVRTGNWALGLLKGSNSNPVQNGRGTEGLGEISDTVGYNAGQNHAHQAGEDRTGSASRASPNFPKFPKEVCGSLKGVGRPHPSHVSLSWSRSGPFNE